MSLLDDIKTFYESESYPPDGPDLDQEFVDGKWVNKDTETELVSEEDLDQGRWGTWFVNVYKRGDEFVAVKDCRPATEMQDWGDYGKPEIYPVIARVEVIKKIFWEKL